MLNRLKAAAAPAALALTLTFSAGGAQAQVPTAVAAPPGKWFIIPIAGYDLAKLGYTTEEFFVSGQATSYKLAAPPPADGRWAATPDKTAPYVTRILVVRPDAAKFNGTVVVEWLNVTAGSDTPVDWWTMHREMIRKGYAWVGVTAQSIGVEGGDPAAPSPTMVPPPLKKINPARYGQLSHPGDAFSFDMFSQVGKLLHSPGAGGVLGPLASKRIIAVGESQSAIYLTTYVDAVAPIARAYDGYLIHSRFGVSARLDGANGVRDLRSMPQDVRIRSDLSAPVFVVQTETDVGGNPPLSPGQEPVPGTYKVRQPDTNRFRVWEIPGAAHADNYLARLGGSDSGGLTPQAFAAALAPISDLPGQKLVKPINFNPAQHYVAQAALRSLDQWIATGKAPAKSAPIKVVGTSSDGVAKLAVDVHGNALGGVRTPWLDVPTAHLAGTGNSAVNGTGVLFGLGEPFDKAKLDQIYPGGKSDYLAKFSAALDATIKAGFILPDDRQEILDVAAAAYDRTQ